MYIATNYEVKGYWHRIPQGAEIWITPASYHPNHNGRQRHSEMFVIMLKSNVFHFFELCCVVYYISEKATLKRGTKETSYV